MVAHEILLSALGLGVVSILYSIPRSQVRGPRSQVPGPKSQVLGPKSHVPCPMSQSQSLDNLNKHYLKLYHTGSRRKNDIKYDYTVTQLRALVSF